jgi:hypothetical protein
MGRSSPGPSKGSSSSVWRNLSSPRRTAASREARPSQRPHVRGIAAVNQSLELKTELLGYLAATSGERAQVIHRIFPLNEALGQILIDLEANDDLRARFEIELRSRPRS